MKKFLLISFLFLNSLFCNEYPLGVSIGADEWDLRMKYCDHANFQWNETVGNENWRTGDAPLIPKLLQEEGQFYVLGIGELAIECTSGNDAYTKFPANGTNNVNYSGYKRSMLDRCNGLDIFCDTHSACIQCNPVTGEFTYVEESMGGTLSDKTWKFTCRTPDNKIPPKDVGICSWGNLGNWEKRTKADCLNNIPGASWRPFNAEYAGSSYTNIFIGRVKIGGKDIDAGFLYGSFACVRGEQTNSKYSQNIKMSSPIRTCVGDGCLNDTLHFDPNDIALLNNKPVGGGTGGGTGGTGGGGASLSDLEPKFAEIKSEINKINHNNTTSTTQLLGKIADTQTSLLLANQNIAISKEVLETKLNEAIQNQDLLSQKITDSEETLKLEFHGVATQSKDEIKDHQTDLNNELKSELEANKQLISDLENQISNYEAGNIEARNNILGGLAGLENQLNGLNSKLDGLASGGGTGGTGGNDDVLAGLGNIDNTLKDGLFDDNQNPYLKNIDDSLKKGQETPEDTGAINSLVGGELGFASNKYHNILNVGFCSKPNNITMNLMGQTFTLIDFSYIDPYVSYIRGLLMTIAGLLGFLIFLRGAR